MKQELNFDRFQEAFRVRGRGDQFSFHALEALFHYLNEIDRDGELDVVGLCSEYVESTYASIVEEHLDILSDEEDAYEWLCKRTHVLWCGDKAALYVNF